MKPFYWFYRLYIKSNKMKKNISNNDWLFCNTDLVAVPEYSRNYVCPKCGGTLVNALGFNLKK